MPYANVNDIRMYYEEQGDPGAIPLILLHGASGAIDAPSSGWTDHMPAFAERYRAIHLEHRGHGRTDNPAGKIRYEMIADDVVAFIEHLGAGPAHIAGVSDGGIVALVVGMTRPDVARALVAVGPNYYNDELVEIANRFADLDLMERERPHEMAILAARHDRDKPAGWWRELYRQLAENLASYPAYSREDLARIPNPTFLIAGGRIKLQLCPQMPHRPFVVRLPRGIRRKDERTIEVGTHPRGRLQRSACISESRECVIRSPDIIEQIRRIHQRTEVLLEQAHLPKHTHHKI